MGAGIAGLLAFGGYLYVTHLQRDNAALRVQVEDYKRAAELLKKNIAALGDELAAAEARAEYYLTIKEAINASPSGDVPADIRTALERLRDGQRD